MIHQSLLGASNYGKNYENPNQAHFLLTVYQYLNEAEDVVSEFTPVGNYYIEGQKIVGLVTPPNVGYTDLYFAGPLTWTGMLGMGVNPDYPGYNWAYGYNFTRINSTTWRFMGAIPTGPGNPIEATLVKF